MYEAKHQLAGGNTATSKDCYCNRRFCSNPGPPPRGSLSEILIGSKSDTPVQVAEAQHKAEGLRKAAQTGSSFANLAKANSRGPSAAQGGTLGCFKRGKLAKELEELVFRMQPGEVSDVLRTKQGWVILQVTDRRPR